MVILLTSQGTWVLGTRVQRVGVFNFGTDRVRVLEKSSGTDWVRVLSMFSTRGCVPDIRPLECIKKYCPNGSISQYTPKGAGIVLHNMISEDYAVQYQPCCQ